MGATNADVIINGVKARLASEVEGGAYKRRTIRREVQNQLLSQSENPALRNRDDGVALYQSSWAQGARWWKPLISPTDLASYYRSNHMDLWTEPGKVVPNNKLTDQAGTTLNDECVTVQIGSDFYAIGSTNVTNALYFDVYKWTPGSNAWVRETTYNSGIPIADQPLSAVYDASDTRVYVLSQDASTGGRCINRFSPSIPENNVDWFTNASGNKYGASIMLHGAGIIYTSGGSLFVINKSGPTQTTIFSDGLVEVLSVPTGTTFFRQEEMAVATPEGIFYAKNTYSNGQYQAWVYRVDRDEAGNWIGVPFAPLPVGSIALALTYHMGSIIVSTTPEPQTYLDQAEHAEVVLYHYTAGQPGALGSVLGRGTVDETPYAFLGTRGPNLYIGGHKRLWIWNAVTGGLHTAWEWPTATTLGPYRTMGWARDSADDGIIMFLGPDRVAYIKRPLETDPDTVTNFGDDETHYTLESNYFDGGLPLELKEVTKVSILRDPGDGDQEWTVQISADDGAFADVLVHSTAGEPHAEAEVTGVTGYSFRYKVIYQTKDATRNALRAVAVEMASGDMLTEWELMLDGSELTFDGIRQNPETFANSMETLAGTNTSVTLIDNYQDVNRSVQDDDAGTSVKVVAVEVLKTTPGESMVRLLLRDK